MKSVNQIHLTSRGAIIIKTLCIFAMLLILVSGCEETFFQEEKSLRTINSNGKIEEIVAGTYARLVDVYNRSYFQKFQRSDDLRQTPNGGFTRMVNNVIASCSYTPGTHPDLDDVYRGLYKTITSVNKLISSVGETDPDSPYLGEAYLIRAYCYFDLVRLFGRVPLVTDVDVKYDLQQSKTSDIYLSIVTDLQSSIATLPETPGEYRKISKGTAKAMLAEVYLAMAGNPIYDDSKYALAAETAGEVIANAETYGFSLVEDFANLWKSEDGNRETVFGLNLPLETEADPFNQLEKDIIYNHPWANVRGTPFQTSFRQGLAGPELNFYANFPDDYRKQASFTGGEYVRKSSNILGESHEWIEFNKIDPFDYELPHCYNRSYIFYIKFTATTRDDEEETVYHMNKLREIPLFRYSHTLLTYAEAKARSGQLDETAYEAINMIRRRANKLDIHSSSLVDIQSGLSADTFADSVVMERSWEFCLEPQGRWFDILRLDLMETINESRHETEIMATNLDEIFPGGSYYARIPQEDRWLNPNLETDEN